MQNIFSGVLLYSNPIAGWRVGVKDDKKTQYEDIYIGWYWTCRCSFRSGWRRLQLRELPAAKGKIY